MAERTVNLSDKPRAVVTLQLGGRSFRISRVVTGVRRLYGEFLRETGELLQKAADIARRQEAAAGTFADGAATADLVAVSEEIEEAARRRHGDLLRMIELILTRNGYEFDPQWWDENADQADLVAFIVESLNKDAPPGQKKTEGLERSLISSG